MLRLISLHPAGLVLNQMLRFIQGFRFTYLSDGFEVLRGLSPQANYTDRATAAGRRS